VLAALHTDHCPPDAVDGFLHPLLEASAERDAPLFASQMFDGSTLSLDENLARSRELLELAGRGRVVLEIEVGAVGGEEDGVRGPEGGRDELYTTSADLLQVADELGTSGYLLAATFGNVHGVYAPGHVELRPDILGAGQRALAERHPGARFRYVFHGSSGSTQDELRAAIAHGVVKVNVDTDMQYAFTRAAAGHMFAHYDGVLKVDGGLGRKAEYDPRAWGREAEAALADRVVQACEQLGSAGRSLFSG
jgi:fructose-bisphosphate aldolase class II